MQKQKGRMYGIHIKFRKNYDLYMFKNLKMFIGIKLSKYLGGILC